MNIWYKELVYRHELRPIFEYGSVVICIAYPTAVNRLESIRNTELKFAMRLLRQIRTQLVLAESEWTSVEDSCKFLTETAM